MAKNILVVDDEVGALTLIGILLERGGFQVLKAKNAKSALDFLNEITPDLIILDVMMPDIDGIELCKILRSRPDTSKTPILMLSARGDTNSIIRSKQAGATDYINKPILNNDLVEKVKSMLDQACYN
jgi:DNA-binding response OmpR family regulator